MGAQENQPQEIINGATDGNGNVETTPATGKDFKGNEDRKIFVGGIAYDVTNDDLSSYFSQFGEVSQAQVKFDRNTGHSRGFAFVEFATVNACKKALGQREQQIKNKQCEIKPAKSRENKKVFVGGLPADFPEEELRKHFDQYGKVEDIEWPFDKNSKARRNFAFIVFEEEDAADRAAATSKQTFGSRDCDVKKAVPQNKRYGFPPTRGGMGGIVGRQHYGGGMRGNAMAMHSQGTPWFNSNHWPPIASGMGGMPAYAAAATTGTAGGWGDWNGYAANAANFYAPSGSSGNAFGNFGSNTYDQYSQGATGAQAMNRQNGSTATANSRY